MLLTGLLFLTLLFYTGLRVLFLLWNFTLFHGISASDVAWAFFAGLRFDLSAIAMLAAPAFLVRTAAFVFRRQWRRATALTFVLFEAPFLIVNLGDTEYVRFTGRRFTLAMMAVTAEVQGKFWSTVLANAALFAIAIFTVAMYLFFCWRWARNAPRPRPGVSWKRQLAVGFAGFALLLIAARGGLQKKPVGFAHAQVFANPVLNHLTMNSTFSLLQSLRRTPLPREKYMSEGEMLAAINGGLPGESLLPKQGLVKGPQNVVIIILESFSLEHMGKIHGDKGYTPFLDELAEKSLFFPNAFANARRSIEGIGAVIGGIPALMSEPFISSQYATNTFFGLGTLLGEAGYSSAFYHGGQNGTMYFDQFTRSAGIKKYVGANEYGHPEESDGSWGIWDEPFFLNMVHDLGSMKEPFAASVFSLSSHTPFKVPAKYEGKFPKGTSEIHEVVGYTDQALREFFEEAAKQPWFDHTLFVITADHTYKPSRPRYQNPIGDYRVPLMFFHPRVAKWPAVDTREPVQHVDILPSILDFLGRSPPTANLMGRSVFKSGERYVVLSSENFYWLITKDHLLTQDPKGEATLARLEDHLGTGFVPDSSGLDEEKLKAKLLHFLQATRQYFSEGLWDNKLYFPSGR